MKEIANLIKLDFTSVKRKIIIPFISIILLVFALELFTLPYVMCLFVMPFIGDFVQPVFSVVEKNKYNKLYGLLPIKRNNIIIARFCFALIILLSTVILAIVLGYITFLFPTGEINDTINEAKSAAEELQKGGFTVELAASLGFMIGCIVTSVTCTLTFIFGIENELQVNLIFAFVTGAIVFICIKAFDISIYAVMNKLAEFISNNIALTFILTYLIGISFLALGALISILVCRKREL